MFALLALVAEARGACPAGVPTLEADVGAVFAASRTPDPSTVPPAVERLLQDVRCVLVPVPSSLAGQVHLAVAMGASARGDGDAALLALRGLYSATPEGAPAEVLADAPGWLRALHQQAATMAPGDVAELSQEDGTRWLVDGRGGLVMALPAQRAALVQHLDANGAVLATWYLPAGGTPDALAAPSPPAEPDPVLAARDRLLAEAAGAWEIAARLTTRPGPEAIAAVRTFLDTYEDAAVEVGSLRVPVSVPEVPMAVEALARLEAARTSSPTLDRFGYAMVRVVRGRFIMGAPRTEAGRQGDEEPHEVDLPMDYAIGATEVTRGLWREVMGPSEHTLGDPRLPVAHVTWFDAVRFCNQLSARDGLAPAYRVVGDDLVIWERGADGYRLPTEAEWEYAARARTLTPFAGGVVAAEVAWHEANAGQKPHEVGMRAPNGWGLRDMSGNVWEWTWDPWSDAPGVAAPEVRLSSRAAMVTRGGSFRSPAVDVRVANREAVDPGRAWEDLGFRVARSLP